MLWVSQPIKENSFRSVPIIIATIQVIQLLLYVGAGRGLQFHTS
jgi:hypothetical protein